MLKYFVSIFKTGSYTKMHIGKLKKCKPVNVFGKECADGSAQLKDLRSFETIDECVKFLKQRCNDGEFDIFEDLCANSVIHSDSTLSKEDNSKLEELIGFSIAEEINEDDLKKILKKYNIYFEMDLWDKTELNVYCPNGNVIYRNFYPDAIARGEDDYSDMTIEISYPKDCIESIVSALNEIENEYKIPQFFEFAVINQLREIVEASKKNEESSKLDKFLENKRN